MRRINDKAVCLLFLVITAAYSFTLEPAVQRNTDTVIRMLINCEFDRALALSDSLMTADRAEPLYAYLRLFGLGLRDIDSDRIIDSMEFLQCYRATLERIDAYERVNGQSSYSMTIRGFAYIAHSSLYLIRGRYFAAAGTGFDAIKLFKEIKKIDRANYDVDLFLGLYNYAKGELKKRFWMVLFWYSGSKKAGIKSVEACSKNGRIASEGARVVLMDIYAREKQYERYASLADSLEVRYPGSRFVLWIRARTSEEITEYAAAAGYYEQLAVAYAQAPYGEYNALVTRSKQIEMLDKAGSRSEAAALARSVYDADACACDERHEKVCKDIRRYLKDK